jgi:hypothetical protein
MGRIEKVGLLLFMLAWPATLAYIVGRDFIKEWEFWILILLIAMAFLGLMTFLFNDQEINININ